MDRLTLDDMIKALKCVSSQDREGDCYKDHENFNHMEDMFRSSMVHHAYIGMNNYCNRCGQKLDWGEEDGI